MDAFMDFSAANDTQGNEGWGISATLCRASHFCPAFGVVRLGTY